MAALLDARGPAYGLYIQAKAVCDDYGRLPADPRKFKAKAAPMSDLSLQEVVDALAAMEQIGVTRTYTVDGERFLEIVSYNDIEGTDWRNVGLPEYPHPPDWTPPPSLTDFLSKYAGANGIYHERYGLTAPRPKHARNATEARSQRDRTATAPRPKHARNADAERLAREAVPLETESKTESEENGLSRASARTTPPALSELGKGKRQTALPETSQALTTLLDWGPHQFTTWLEAAGRSLDSPAAELAGLTDAMVAEAIRAAPPTNTSRGDWYVDKLIERRQRGQPEETDPFLAAYIANYGPRPTDDDAGAQIWDARLASDRRAAGCEED